MARAESRGGGVTSGRDVVVFFDVDDTLLDNDHVIADHRSFRHGGNFLVIRGDNCAVGPWERLDHPCRPRDQRNSADFA